MTDLKSFKVNDLKAIAKNLGIHLKGTKKDDIIDCIKRSNVSQASIDAEVQKLASAAQPAPAPASAPAPKGRSRATTGADDGTPGAAALASKINEILQFLAAQDARIRAMDARLKVLEQRDPKAAAKTMSGDAMLPLVERAYNAIDRKIADKVPVSDVIAAIKRQTNLADDDIYNRLVELFYSNKIDLQLGKPAFGETDDAFTRKFYWLGLKR